MLNVHKRLVNRVCECLDLALHRTRTTTMLSLLVRHRGLAGGGRESPGRGRFSTSYLRQGNALQRDLGWVSGDTGDKCFLRLFPVLGEWLWRTYGRELDANLPVRDLG